MPSHSSECTTVDDWTFCASDVPEEYDDGGDLSTAPTREDEDSQEDTPTNEQSDEEEQDGDESDTPVPTKERASEKLRSKTFNSEIHQILEDTFDPDVFWTEDQRNNLCRNTGLTRKQLAKWRNNRKTNGPAMSTISTSITRTQYKQLLQEYKKDGAMLQVKRLAREFGLSHGKISSWVSRYTRFLQHKKNKQR
ncbi:hypothetical protein PROFUN_01695 [Planoprotostelium fungivorum]|uniref:Homeobox domain-containing protein n=1 Tax=Planoprotostelium fungivorum TaxID=1890364 RepID=A0A2P6MWA0_9EUKA|nr:hypothetical protein PROFUN_01695 [Planoprotostelium fungivorum]